MLKKRNQKGFTLIEIIAVLVILGILAAVAIPKYFDLQTDAQRKAVSGAVAALQSSATQAYAQQLLNGQASATSWTAPTGTIVLGDFAGNISGTQQVNVQISNGPSGYTFPMGTYSWKTFNMW
jgi:prepilin-type N-terminal cleavage/methylation domain-containing protein